MECSIFLQETKKTAQRDTLTVTGSDGILGTGVMFLNLQGLSVYILRNIARNYVTNPNAPLLYRVKGKLDLIIMKGHLFVL